MEHGFKWWSTGSSGGVRVQVVEYVLSKEYGLSTGSRVEHKLSADSNWWNKD